MIYIVEEDLSGLRLDQYLSEKSEYSRSYLQKLIKNQNVKINGSFITKNKVPVNFGDEISIFIPEPEEMEIKPEKLNLDILYEDDDIILINKPKNMVVHPSPGHMEHTLVNGLLYHCKGNLSGINGILRPGIVHRIDKDTTGVLVACKTNIAHQELAKQLSVHSITRKYEAIVYNNFKDESGTIDKNIGRHPVDRKKMAIVAPNEGRRAVTHYRVLDHLNNKFNHIECQLETGRTHQIRVHMSSIKHPILGDEIYGIKNENKFKNLSGQTLHAKILGFIHPTKNQYIEFEAPLPQYFVELLKTLKNI